MIPVNCRNRLQREGKPYPKSGCHHCVDGGFAGCPFQVDRSATHNPDGTRRPNLTTALDDAFHGGSLVGRVVATAERFHDVIAERDQLKRENEALCRRLAGTSEGRAVALAKELGAL